MKTDYVGEFLRNNNIGESHGGLDSNSLLFNDIKDIRVRLHVDDIIANFGDTMTVFAILKMLKEYAIPHPRDWIQGTEGVMHPFVWFYGHVVHPVISSILMNIEDISLISSIRLNDDLANFTADHLASHVFTNLSAPMGNDPAFGKAYSNKDAIRFGLSMVELLLPHIQVVVENNFAKGEEFLIVQNFKADVYGVDIIPMYVDLTLHAAPQEKIGMNYNTFQRMPRL